MLAPPFAWLADVSDAFPGSNQSEEDEEVQVAAVQLMTACMPVCAQNCEDGELFYRTLCAWAVPWTKVPLDTFLPAWFGMSARRRRKLLRKHMCFTEELCQPKKWTSPHAFFPKWVERMCERDDVRMLRALAATEVPLPHEDGWYEEEQQQVGGGVLSRSGKYQRARKDKRAWERELVRLCIIHNAVECLAAWTQSRNWSPGNWPGAIFKDSHIGFRCVQRGQTAVLRLIGQVGCYWLGGTKRTFACATAAGHGQLECLRYLCEEAGYHWKHYSVWTAAKDAGHSACMDYLESKGCPTTAPPPVVDHHGNVQVTFWSVVYRRYTNFAVEDV